MTRTTTAAGLLLLATLPALAADQGVEWRSDYDAARKEATTAGRPLFLQVSSEDCFHCRRLDAGPLREPAVVGLLNDRYIPLRVDAARSPKLVEALRVNAYPTMIIAAPDGRILAFLEGFHDARALVEQLQRTLGGPPPAPDPAAANFQAAAKAVEAGDYARAVPLLKTLAEDGKDKAAQAKARATLDEIEQQAAGRLARARRLQEDGRPQDAADLLTDMAGRYAGTRAAADGAKLLASLPERPDPKSSQRERRARALLAQAKEVAAGERYNAALELCNVLVTDFKDLPEGRLGAELADGIRSSPEKLALACENLNERLAAMYATLGEAALKKGEKPQAAGYFEKAVRAAPASLVARDAQAKLTALSVKTPAMTTEFHKPEK